MNIDQVDLEAVKVAASKVKSAARSLQTAIDEAASLGIEVDLNILDESTLGEPLGHPIIDVRTYLDINPDIGE